MKAETIRTLAITMTAAAAIWGVSATVVSLTGPSFDFQREVHGHMENAYFADSPELMIAELHAAESGMRNLRLTPELYGAILPWGKTPDVQMDYQYRHIDAIIQRAEQARPYCDPGNVTATGAQLSDVCGQKLSAIRQFIKGMGYWSDDIAKDAFFANFHPLLYLGLDIFCALAAAAIGLWIWTGVAWGH